MIGPEEETVSRWIDVSAIGPEGTAFDIVFDDKAIAVLVARVLTCLRWTMCGPKGKCGRWTTVSLPIST